MQKQNSKNGSDLFIGRVKIAFNSFLEVRLLRSICDSFFFEKRRSTIYMFSHISELLAINLFARTYFKRIFSVRQFIVNLIN